MSQRDLNRLDRAAAGLADRLSALRIGSLKVASTFAPEEHYNGGWSTEVAKWSAHGVTIAVSLDRYSRARKRSFWAGFWSRELAPIRRLLVGDRLAEVRVRQRLRQDPDRLSRCDRSAELRPSFIKSQSPDLIEAVVYSRTGACESKRSVTGQFAATEHNYLGW